MFKNTLKALTSFTLLLGCYYGYVAAFGWVVEQFKASNTDAELVFPQHASNSKKQADALALEEMGTEHWSVKNEHLFAFYNAEHGFWAYTLNAEQTPDRNGAKYEGKRMVMTPFLMIWKSSNGKSNHVLECEEATLDMSQPLGLSSKSNSEPNKVKHALFERDVRIRDDRGTPRDRRDDMNIGPMRRVEFDDSSQQINTDDHVVIKDPDTLVTGDGMVIQLRTISEEERALTPNASSGFAGADYIIFRKSVHVNMRNVGNSGMLPGSSAGKKPAVVSSDVRPAAGGTPDAVPMDITCDGPMRIDMAEKPDEVLVGPPTPPDPTRVQFDRNVVACRGALDLKPGPDQLLCDTLRLTLVPGNSLPSPPDNATAASRPRPKPPNASTVADAGKPETKGSGTPESPANATPPAAGGGSLFGNLTLKRAHATGHAVWLYLPASGVKLLCNELIHERLLPFKPDLTYFRGDRTRRLEIEKIDTVKEGADIGKVATVTRIWTDDATMFDDGGGMDKANIRARGQGRLEIHSERGPAVDRIAIWQKELNVYNVLAPDGEIQTKLIWLEGTRPRFIDRLQNVSIDSADMIKIWLKPKLPKSVVASAAPNASVAVTTGAEIAPDLAHGATPSSGGGMDAGDLQIEKLVAIRDVHLNAPNRKMTARDRLDADFIEAEPVLAEEKKPVAAAANEDLAAAQPATEETGGAALVAQTTAQPPGGSATPDPAKAVAAAPQPTVLPMTAIGNKVWAKVELVADTGKKKTPEAVATEPKPAATTGAGSDVRELWMWGAVAIHQDPAPDKKKGEDVSGEAVYLLNRGEGRALTKIFQRDPNEVTKRTTRLPLARVTTDDMDITGRIIQMDQEVDKIWVDGEGTLTQMTARGMFSDKSAKPADTDVIEVKPTAAVMAREDSGDKPNSESARRTTRSTHQARGTGPEPAGAIVATKPKMKMRAGVPVSDKELMTITWTERMEFDGRTTDPEGRPSARADFYGIVDMRMTDSGLHCTKKMIAFTDKEVPLAQLGKMSKPRSETADGREAADNGDAAEAKEPQAELALLYCYGEPWMATRKMDEDTPVTLQKQWIEAKERIDYDRRTGNFFVPGPGITYLYDRNKNSDSPRGETPATGKADEARPAEAAGRSGQRRTVTPTSGLTQTRGGSTVGTAKGSRAAQPTGSKTDRNGPPPMILTEIHFSKEMRGRLGTGQNGDDSENRWSEFFGDVQVRREEVPNEVTKFKMDSYLRKDGFYLTSQVLRVITEPAPIGSPPKTPARNFMKAWEKATANTVDKTIKSDVITYDSSNDQIHAYGEEGRKVLVVRQLGNDQPSSSEQGTAAVMNPKTGAFQMHNSSTVRIVEESGSRPSLVPPPDPNAKPPKKNKQQFRVPNGSLERRGFTGS